MKVRVTVEGHMFEVDVLDPRARPVVAVVEGERFELWPEEAQQPASNGAPERRNGAAAGGAPVPASPAAARPSAQPAERAGAPAVVAPIPGVIISVAVQPGQAVTVGQELCVLEAMKMENIIRAPRSGVVSRVHVAPGRTVKHRELLVEIEG